MAQKLTGMLNLSKIPKELLYETKNGDKAIFIDIIKKKDGEDKYGNTHSIQLYDKEAKQVIYLGNVKPQEFGGSKGSADVANHGGFAGKDDDSDLPF